jgi:acetoin utilization protein AcuB
MLKKLFGLISINAMNEYFAKITSVSQPGGIIVLEINNKNNSLAHMAQIVESDNAQILKLVCAHLPRFNPDGGYP